MARFNPHHLNGIPKGKFYKPPGISGHDLPTINYYNITSNPSFLDTLEPQKSDSSTISPQKMFFKPPGVVDNFNDLATIDYDSSLRTSSYTSVSPMPLIIYKSPFDRDIQYDEQDTPSNEIIIKYKSPFDRDIQYDEQSQPQQGYPLRMYPEIRYFAVQGYPLRMYPVVGYFANPNTNTSHDPQNNSPYNDFGPSTPLMIRGMMQQQQQQQPQYPGMTMMQQQQPQSQSPGMTMMQQQQPQSQSPGMTMMQQQQQPQSQSPGMTMMQQQQQPQSQSPGMTMMQQQQPEVPSYLSYKNDENKFRADIRSIYSSFNNEKNQERENQVRLHLNTLATFVEYIKKKQDKWLSDLEYGSTEFGRKIDEKIASLSTMPERSSARDSAEEVVTFLLRRVVNIYVTKSNVNYSTFKKFFTQKSRRGIKYILDYIADNMKLNDFTFDQQQELTQQQQILKQKVDTYKELKGKFESMINELKAANKSFYDRVEGVADTLDRKWAALNDEERRINITVITEKAYTRIRDQADKINSFYELRYPLFEMILDSQFYILYVIKAIRILFTYVALFLTVRMFVPLYEDAVYDGKTDPPPLWKFLLIYLAFDISLNVFMLVLLYLVKYLFKNDDNTFLIDGHVINQLLIDYAIGMSIILIIGYLIGRIITQKKYFKYKYEGLRGIRAFETIMFNVAAVNILIPYYMIG